MVARSKTFRRSVHHQRIVTAVTWLGLCFLSVAIPLSLSLAEGPRNCGLHVLNDFRNLCQGTSSSVCIDSPNGMDNGFMMGNFWGLTGEFPGNFSYGESLSDYVQQMPNNSYAPLTLDVDQGNAHWVGIFRDSEGNLWFRDPQAGVNVPLTASNVEDLISRGYHLDGDLGLLPKPLPVGPLQNPSFDCTDGLRTEPLDPGCRRPPLDPPPPQQNTTSLGRRGPHAHGDGPEGPIEPPLGPKGRGARSGGVRGKAIKGCGAAVGLFFFYQNTCRFADACENGDIGAAGEAAWDQFGPPISPWEARRSYDEAIESGASPGEAVAATPFIMYGHAMAGIGCAIATGAECVFGWTSPKGSKALPGVWSPWRESEH